MILWLVVLGLALCVAWLVLSPPDVDTAFIASQSSLSQVRAVGESAVYRSAVNEHGRPLLGTQSLANFRLASIWESESFNVLCAAADGHSYVPFDLSAAVQRYGPALQALCEGSGQARVLVALSSSAETLAIILACSLYGIELFLTSPETLENAETVELVEPAVVVGEADIGNFTFKNAIPVCIGKGTEKVASLDAFQTSEPIPHHTDTSPVAFTFVDSTGLRPVSHEEVGRAIVSQMKALAEDRWTPKDKVLIFSIQLSPYSLLLQLTALSCKSALYYVGSGFLQPFKIVEVVMPTIITTDDLTLRSLARLADDFGPLKLILKFIGEVRLAHGRLCKALLPVFNSVRLVHSEAVMEDSRGLLLPSEINSARVLMGSQVIHALATPQIFVPVAQTRVGDYRVGTGKLINFGAICPGIEVKVTGPLADTGRGNLCVRTHQWIETSLQVELHGDGCLYLDAPEPETPVIYAAHGHGHGHDHHYAN